MIAENQESCLCSKCFTKNTVIEYMLQAMTNQNIKKQEEFEMNYYNRKND
jgi:hypothetical protein